MNINPFNLSKEEIDNLLKQASESFNIPKEELKEKLLNNDIDSILQNENIKNIKAIQKILQNPEMVQKFINYQKEKDNK